MGRRPKGTGPIRPKEENLKANEHITEGKKELTKGNKNKLLKLLHYDSDEDRQQEHDKENTQDDITDDDSLPPGWQEVKDPDSKDTYYWNSVTGETTWDRPVNKQRNKKAKTMSPNKNDQHNCEIEKVNSASNTKNDTKPLPSPSLSSENAIDIPQKTKEEVNDKGLGEELEFTTHIEPENNAAEEKKDEPNTANKTLALMEKEVTKSSDENSERSEDEANSTDDSKNQLGEMKKIKVVEGETENIESFDKKDEPEQSTKDDVKTQKSSAKKETINEIVWDLELTSDEVTKLKSGGAWMFWQDLMWLLRKGPGMDEKTLLTLRAKLEARIEDWREEGISDDFLVKRVRQMSEFDFENEDIEENKQNNELNKTEEKDDEQEHLTKKSSDEAKQSNNLDEGILEFMSEIASSDNKAQEIEEGVEEFMQLLETDEQSGPQQDGAAKDQEKPQKPPAQDDGGEISLSLTSTAKVGENSEINTEKQSTLTVPNSQPENKSPPHSLTALLGGYGDDTEDEDEDESEDDEKAEIESNSMKDVQLESAKSQEPNPEDSMSAKAAALSAKAAAMNEKFAAILASAKAVPKAQAPPQSFEDEEPEPPGISEQESSKPNKPGEIKVEGQPDVKNQPVSEVDAKKALPEGWEAHWDEEESRYYYFNPLTHESTWEIPQHSSSEADPKPKEPQSEIESLRDKSVLLFSPAGDLWKGHQISGLFEGCGKRHFRSLGQGYYMMTFSTKDITARAIVMAAEDGVSALESARREWTKCKRDVFIRYVGAEDPSELYDLPCEYFEDPKPAIVSSQVISKGPMTVARAQPALYKTEVVQNAPVLTKSFTVESAPTSGSEVDSASEISEEPPGTQVESSRRALGSGNRKKVPSKGAKKKSKIDTSLINKWKKVAKTEQRANDPILERKRKTAEWEKNMIAAGDNPNFTPVGGGIPGGGEKLFKKEASSESRRKSSRSKRSTR